MKPAKKWNFKKRIYKDIVIDDACKTYCEDMGQIVVCPSCKKKLVFGETYTSRRIFEESGCFGYGVCKPCSDKEYQDEFSHKKIKWSD